MSIDLVYLGALRDTMGRDGERIDPPSHVLTVADLIRWMAARGDRYAAAFADGAGIGAAIEAEPAGPEDSIFGAREVAFFPPPGAL